MESLEDLKQEIRKLNIEKSTLEDEIRRLRENARINFDRLQEAENLHNSVPRDFFVQNAAEAFLVGEKELNILNLLENKNILKFLEHSNDISFSEDNEIFLGKKKLGLIKDETLKIFLKEIVPILPYLYKIYTRYYHFSTLCLKIDKYEYLGKDFQNRMQGDNLFNK